MATAGVAEDSVVVVVLVAVADTPEAERPAVEVELASADPASVVVRGSIIAEACASLMGAPDSFVPRLDPPPLPDRIAT